MYLQLGLFFINMLQNSTVFYLEIVPWLMVYTLNDTEF